MDPANFDNLCRICLQTLPKKRKECYAFDESLEKYDDTTFAEAFLSCTGANVRENEPQHMCLPCGNELMLAFDLRIKCFQTQEMLDKALEDANFPQEVETFDYEDSQNLMSATTFDELAQETVMEEDIVEEEEIEYKPDIKPKIIVMQKKQPFTACSQCEYCSSLFPSRSAYRIHLETEHYDQKCHECPHCLQIFFQSTLESHLKSCTSYVIEPIEIKTEKRKGTPNGANRKGMCPVCAQIRSQYHIKWHIERSQQLDDKGNIITHPYICDICGVRKTAKSYILQHIRNEHLNKFVKCRYCPAEFKHPSTLYSHERRDHSDKCPLLKCKFCEFTSATHSSLRVHTYSKHTGEKKHECPICFAKFVTKWKLNEHLGSHTTDTPFACDVCNGKFKTKEGVRRHKTKVHGIYKMKR